MEQPPFSLRPSPWILLATAAIILVLAGIASMRHPPWGPVALLCGGAGIFVGMAVLLARRRS